jgi:hypothetical protein
VLVAKPPRCDGARSEFVAVASLRVPGLLN